MIISTLEAMYGSHIATEPLGIDVGKHHVLYMAD
jgi:hypothetical protein